MLVRRITTRLSAHISRIIISRFCHIHLLFAGLTILQVAPDCNVKKSGCMMNNEFDGVGKETAVLLSREFCVEEEMLMTGGHPG